jgi:3-methyladenine DNA glycosylase AlkD
MTAGDIVDQLKKLGKDSYKKVLLNHGIQEPVFGVSVAEFKKIQKKVKRDYQLALDLFDTGIYDAMYLAGLVADDSKMTKKDLQNWAKKANCYSLREYTVAWVASGSNHGYELARDWIDSKNEGIASTGWATLGCLVSIKENDDLDLDALKALLQRVEKTIHDQPNRVRYTMNMFVICVGGYVKPLSEPALQISQRLGRVTVNMGDTACKVPYAPDYIKKMHARGSLGKKLKTAKC